MAQKRRRARKTAVPRSRRWVALAVGLIFFAGAFNVLARGGGAPLPNEIRPASRAELERLLEREDRP